MRLDVPPAATNEPCSVVASSTDRLGKPHSGILTESETGLGDNPLIVDVLGSGSGHAETDLLNSTVRLGTRYLRYDQDYPSRHHTICGCCDKPAMICLVCGKICRGPFKTDGSHSCHTCDANEKKQCIECSKLFSIKYPGQFCRSCRRHRLKDRDSMELLPGNDAHGKPIF